MKNILFFCACIFLCSCNKSSDDEQIACTEEFIYGLNVTVRDANTSGVLTDAEVTVTASEGSYQETLEFFDSVFLGAGERPGNYIIQISGSNYQTFSSAVSVLLTEDNCHVIPQSREFTVQPN